MNPNPDRLYELLPVIYRQRDAEQGYPLRALLQVIAEQVDVVEQDIAQLYDNWFIETAQDWVVPYLGELIGYRPVHEAGEPGDPNAPQGAARNRILVSRREVANTIRYRRRKGTLALLETLAYDVAGWPARVVEFFKLLGWTQNLNHPHFDRARTVDVRDGDALDLLHGPFERIAHTVDVRRINSSLTRGRYNIPSVGVFVWRLKSYPVTGTPAYCVEDAGPHCYTFSVLGNDTPLYIHPERETDPTSIADELNLPAPIRRRPFEKSLADYYSPDKSVAIWLADQRVPLKAIIPADLSDWQYYPPRDRIAVDPVLGRITFPPTQLPKKNVRVHYHYAFSADLGGGEYERAIVQPQTSTLYRVGETERFKRIGDALRQWQLDKPQHAVIELADSGVYVEPIHIQLEQDHSLQLRAANHTRPVIRLLDWQTDLPDALSVAVAPGSRFTLDGLLITGRAVHIKMLDREPAAAEDCPAEVIIRHCTLVPGWGLYNDCEPRRPAEPSLELYNVRARVCIEHSILGSIQVNVDQVHADPIPINLSDSLLDATGSEREAIGAPGRPVAQAVLTFQRCTVFGIVQVHAIELAENSIFNDCLNVARRQLGCLRFCYVPIGCRTPRRYSCQPDLVDQPIQTDFAQGQINETERDRRLAIERQRVQPQFTARRYGEPGYAQLALTCAEEIKRGADDESEMGAFHDLYQPQREANLRARLDEYTPAGTNAGIIFAS
ncbi:hypothetical protein TFLX_01790 [Thermoflexales bacterium]|nr:hypothetical protein TFLX_01790 [Thermoflexales bacterium]